MFQVSGGPRVWRERTGKWRSSSVGTVSGHGHCLCLFTSNLLFCVPGFKSFNFDFWLTWWEEGVGKWLFPWSLTRGSSSQHRFLLNICTDCSQSALPLFSLLFEDTVVGLIVPADVLYVAELTKSLRLHPSFLVFNYIWEVSHLARLSSSCTSVFQVFFAPLFVSCTFVYLLVSVCVKVKLELQVVMSCHLGAENWTLILWKSGQCF